MTPIANTNRSETAIPTKLATHEEERRRCDREHGHESSHADELALQRAASSRWVRCARSAMRPNRVLIPVAVTTASPVPAVTYVPAKTDSSGAAG